MNSRRSVLLLSGEDIDVLRQAIINSSADMVCLDLEDTVAPSQKAQARTRIAKLLSEDIWGRSQRAVRINALSSPYIEDDLDVVLRESNGSVDTLFLSKVETSQDVVWVDRAVTQLSESLNIERRITLCAGIESARALTDIDTIAASSERLDSLGFAIGDLSISLGTRIGAYLHDRSLYPGDLHHFAKSRINLAAKTHGLQALDGPWPIVNDRATLIEDTRWGAMLGFDGKMALAEQQVKTIHEVYRPTQSEIDHANKMLELYEKSVQAGRGAGVVEGEFFDPVTVGLAKATISRAQAPI
ncbi:CoA ester lyase [Paraburkholderia sp. CNPSo 3281]|uniref:HpcH/HpaI aldolase/citrate lyase family protein n=1 Tax=Paraburkholderia sp. CNPSo 3281 TaxID=2940933 RepID=UPI0020B6D2A1|nr:CoA ester lyase [Paraburkholderia sp. CNPSo 3281]MCP3720625.1 CoA ester lyase [Paraburkholderia sp. CNPSo 3281]